MGDPGTVLAGSNIVKNAAVSLLTVKVIYFLMAHYVSSSEEYFVLQSPAVLRDLLNDVVKRHPSLAPMMATMEILKDGATVKFDSTLRDGDEVDFHTHSRRWLVEEFMRPSQCAYHVFPRQSRDTPS